MSRAMKSTMNRSGGFIDGLLSAGGYSRFGYEGGSRRAVRAGPAHEVGELLGHDPVPSLVRMDQLPLFDPKIGQADGEELGEDVEHIEADALRLRGHDLVCDAVRIVAMVTDQPRH